MECKIERNKALCTCTYNCSKRGMCCECVKAHREAGEIPGCFFSKEGEKTYNRSVEFFIKNTTIVD